MAQREKLSVKTENRVGIFLLGGNIVGLSARRNRQPRSRLAESRIRPIAPLHRRALSVAAFFQRPAQLADGILDLVLALRVVVLHPQFFAVIRSEERRVGKELRSGWWRGDVERLAREV